ncbi:MAG TPA: glycosyltransferase [Phycisphaerae bacterium]|nr:glycosyltransferase [Phycisphaerae bacterium]
MTVRHFRRRPRRAGCCRPAVAVLKPLCGIEPGSYECLASFCRQTYPRYALLFGVAHADDAAAGLVRRLQRNFPRRHIELHIGEVSGLNPKVKILQNLAHKTDAPILMVSDCDVLASPDYIARMVQPLQSHDVGLVICPYAMRRVRTLTDRLESLRLAAEFIPSAVLAHRFGAAVGLGAAMAFRRSDLDALGGFHAISDFLLEDQRLALDIKRAGKRVALLPDTVGLRAPANSLRFSQRREIRWARGIRSTGRLRYLGIALTYMLPLLLLACAALWIDGTAWPLQAVAALFFLRLVLALVSARAQAVRFSALDLGLFPLRDALSFLTWCLGLFGRRIIWRGRPFFLRSDGRLSTKPPLSPPARALQSLIRTLDLRLRTRQGIFEFSSDPQCLLRIERAAAGRRLRLTKGLEIRPDDPIGELHLWNEHLPPTEPAGDLSGSKHLWRLTLHSLEQLAHAALTDPRLAGLSAFHGRVAFLHRGGECRILRLFRTMGFDVLAPQRTFLQRCHDELENLFLWALTWTFNRGSLRGKPFRRPRLDLWISRRTLLARYAHPQEQALTTAGRP